LGNHYLARVGPDSIRIKYEEVVLSKVHPRVTVIVVFLNQEKYLAEAVESILSQTWCDWELLLVDDGSTDASTGIAREYEERNPGRVKYFEHPSHANLGISISRNLGLTHAQGEYIAFLDADDIWTPRKLERQVEILDEYLDAALTFGRLLFFTDEQDIPIPQGLAPLRVPAGLLRPPTIFHQSLVGPGGMLWTSGGILFRKQSLLEVGAFEASFPGMGEDAVVWLKINLSYSVYAMDELVLRYRRHSAANGIIDWRNRSLTSGWLKVMSWLHAYVQKQPFLVRQWATPIVNEALFRSFKEETWNTVTNSSESFARRWASVTRLCIRWLQQHEITAWQRFMKLPGLILGAARAFLRLRSRCKTFWRAFAT